MGAVCAASSATAEATALAAAATAAEDVGKAVTVVWKVRAVVTAPADMAVTVTGQ